MPDDVTPSQNFLKHGCKLVPGTTSNTVMLAYSKSRCCNEACTKRRKKDVLCQNHHQKLL
jgi:hypothetical protein